MSYHFNGYSLDVQGRRLLRIDTQESIPVTAKALDLLIYMVERRGTVISKDDLLAAVWPRVVVEENALERQIHLLRKALGETRGDNHYIANVPGRGYSFIAKVRPNPEAEPQAAVGGTTAAPNSRTPTLERWHTRSPLAELGVASYQRPFCDAFALQDELATAIAQRALPAGHTTSPPCCLRMPRPTRISSPCARMVATSVV